VTLDKSPSLDDYKQGFPDKPPVSPNRRRRVYILIAASNIFVLVALMLFVFIKSNPGQILGGSGTVSGRVVGLDGAPQVAEIIIMNTDLKTSSDGYGKFQLQDVPGGRQSLIVIIGISGYEFPVDVRSGSSVEMGDLRIVPTPGPGDHP
jgi:hypothetical protein